VDIELRGLAGEQRNDASRVFFPVIRRSTTSEKPPVQLLDVVSCWKGLTWRQASEIMLWEKALKKSLEDMVARELLDDFGEHIQNTQGESLGLPLF